MILSHKNMRKVLATLDKSKILRVLCNKNLHSICSLFIFTQILKKELLKFQIEFLELESAQDIYFKTDEDEYIFSAEESECTCSRQEMCCVMLLFNAVKAMDFLRIETVWPAVVCYIFYKKQFSTDLNSTSNKIENTNSKTSKADNFAKENISNYEAADKLGYSEPLQTCITDEVCKKCKDFQKELIFSIKVLNCKSEGIFYRQQINLDFLLGSTLFLSIKNNINFILDKKLFFMKPGGSDRKIHEFLAKNGISIPSANEEFSNLDSNTRNLASLCFGQETKFVIKYGHDLELSAIEHAFLLLFYLYKGKEMYSYMCLEKRKLIDTGKSCKFYHKLISIFRETVLNSTKAEDIVVFQSKSGEYDTSQLNVISHILFYFSKFYLSYRGMHKFRSIILFISANNSKDEVETTASSYKKDDVLILYSQDCNFDFVDSSLKYGIGRYFIKIKSKSLNLVLKQLMYK